jgi:hypothetical protein
MFSTLLNCPAQALHLGIYVDHEAFESLSFGFLVRHWALGIGHGAI